MATGVQPCGTKIWVTLCDFTPRAPVLEIAQGDVLIQEIDSMLNSGNPDRPRYPTLRNNQPRLVQVRSNTLQKFYGRTNEWFCEEKCLQAIDSRNLAAPSGLAWSNAENKYIPVA